MISEGHEYVSEPKEGLVMSEEEIHRGNVFSRRSFAQKLFDVLIITSIKALIMIFLTV